jgi:hypothetical protein
MQLEEFIKTSIEQIFRGVKAPHGVVQEQGGSIDGDYTSTLEFDVAVTATEEKKSKKNAGVSAWGIGVAGEGSNEHTNSSVSRIKFSINVNLPNTAPDSPRVAAY